MQITRYLLSITRNLSRVLWELRINYYDDDDDDDNNNKQDRQCTYYATLRPRHETIVAL
jgi:hypothetical protein